VTSNTAANQGSGSGWDANGTSATVVRPAFTTFTASEIKADTARAELAEATAQRITDEKSFDDRQRRMTRARVMQQLASK